LKLVLDVQIPLPPDETEVEEEEDKDKGRRLRMKVKYDENSFPTVPWPDAKLDTMSKEELIEYIRLCKRTLKQGATQYATLLNKIEKQNTQHELIT